MANTLSEGLARVAVRRALTANRAVLLPKKLRALLGAVARSLQQRRRSGASAPVVHP